MRKAELVRIVSEYTTMKKSNELDDNKNNETNDSIDDPDKNDDDNRIDDNDTGNNKNKKVCDYDGKCYRRNPEHFREYQHPKQNNTSL